MEVLVEHDYVAKEPNELTIAKGDIIKDVVRKQGSWMEGTLNDKKGLFPDNFVKVMDKEPSVVLRNRRDASRIRQCRVVFSYKQDHEDELNLNVGEIIDILGEEEEGWWRGVLNGRQGVFPSNFVEEITPPLSKQLRSSKENLTNSVGSHETLPPLFAKPLKTLCEVRFPYKAQNEDELTLVEGDVVTLLSTDGQDPGWWKGELNGTIGVFPDNFVTILSSPAEDDKRAKPATGQTFLKPGTTVNSTQRKSLELINSEKLEAESSIRTTPPLPGKKPSIPIKKSPSGSGSAGGIFYGIKRKIADVVDGATGSKISPTKTESKDCVTMENAFDDVHRRPLLSDVRATRPKAPGRRPPSIVGKDQEPGLMNGNADHGNIAEVIPEAANALTSSSEGESGESKPKLPEWAKKQPAPWLEEMKLNQAKRSSSMTGSHDKPKLTPTEKSEPDDRSKLKKEASPVDKSKSIHSLSGRMKTPPNEFPMIRNKPNVPIPSRPQTIQSVANLQDVYASKPLKASPNRSKSPTQQHKADSSTENVSGDGEDVSHKNYIELQNRIAKLEETIEKQQQVYEAAIEELRGKLHIEVEMRMKLQAKFEQFIEESAIQQL